MFWLLIMMGNINKWLFTPQKVARLLLKMKAKQQTLIDYQPDITINPPKNNECYLIIYFEHQHPASYWAVVLLSTHIPGP